MELKLGDINPMLNKILAAVSDVTTSVRNKNINVGRVENNNWLFLGSSI